MSSPILRRGDMPTDDHFRQFALFFGGSSDQEQTLRYLQLLTPRSASGAQSSRSSLSARARRELLESLRWQPAMIRAPFQTWVADRLGDSSGMLVLTERFFPRREARGDGIVQVYSHAEASVVSGQLGLFLTYVSNHGRATIDARLAQSTGAPRLELALDMIDSARNHLPSAFVVAGASFGNDATFREALRSRNLAFLVEVDESCPVFWSPSNNGRLAARRRTAVRARDLTRGAVGSVLENVANAADITLQPIWDSLGNAVGSPAWAIRLPLSNGTSAKIFLGHSESAPTAPDVQTVSDVLAHPTEQLGAAPGASTFDRYDSVASDPWHRHMTIAMLASSWTSESLSDPANNAGPPDRGVSAAIQASAHVLPKPETASASASMSHMVNARSVFLTLVVAALALGVAALTTIARSLPSLGQRDLIRVSSFYHPPDDGTSINALVARTGQVIFTRGDERYLQQMHELGFQGPSLQYLVSNEVSGPERATSAAASCGEYLQTGNDVTGIARDFCSALHRDERNFIHNGKGERLYSELSYQEGNTRRTRYYYLMNPGSQAWREYFAERAAENVASLPYNGIFLDNIDLTPRRASGNEKNSDGKVAEYSGDRVYRDAVVGYLETLRNRLPTTPIWANLTEGDNLPDDYASYLPYLDGVMNEYFITQDRGRIVGPNGWIAQIAQADSVLSQGKSFLAVAQGTRNDTNRMRFALASYLMIAGPNTYFRYANGERYQEAWQYDDFENRLGSPLGARYQDGDQWRRDFACGTVSVDIERRAGDIRIRSNQTTCLVERVVLRVPFLRGLLAPS